MFSYGKTLYETAQYTRQRLQICKQFRTGEGQKSLQFPLKEKSLNSFTKNKKIRRKKMLKEKKKNIKKFIKTRARKKKRNKMVKRKISKNIISKEVQKSLKKQVKKIENGQKKHEQMFTVFEKLKEMISKNKTFTTLPFMLTWFSRTTFRELRIRKWWIVRT